MEFFWFLAGFALGLSCLGWYRIRLRVRLQRILRHLRSAAYAPSFSSLSQLMLAVAEQQQTCQELMQQTELWKQLLYQAPVGYVQVDEENQMVWCTPLAGQLLGIQNCNLERPRLLLEVVRSYELDHLIEQTRNAQEPHQLEWLFHPVSPDATSLSRQRSRPLRGYSLPLPEGQVGVFLEDRQEVTTLTQQRDRWASDVAHELKTPLTSIRLVAETLESRLAPPLRDWVERLLREVIRLSTLVQELLDLSQLDRQPPRLALKTVDLVALVHSAWLSLEPLARKRQIHLLYEGPPTLSIQADEPRLYRVLINLLDNSLKYSPPQQSVRVEIMVQDNTWIELQVIDQGPGFPQDSLPYVFERFYRGDPSRARNHPDIGFSAQTEVESGQHPLFTADVKAADPAPHGQATTPSMVIQPHQPSSGSGLGLAIVRQIVEAHQGTVSASNHLETGGACLTVLLPLEPKS